MSAFIVPESSFASDQAVRKLLEGPQPVRRSQIISNEKLAKIDKENIKAKIISQKAKNGMVIIPKGKFLSGEDKQTVYLKNTYLLDVTEVSNKQYKRFLDNKRKPHSRYIHPSAPASKKYTPRYWKKFLSKYFKSSPAAKVAPFDSHTFSEPDNPVVGVDWWDAYAFCKSIGKRLPDEHEWEKGARGIDGRIWPWGSEWSFSKANTGGDKWGEVDGYIYAANVVSFGSGVSPYGALNMAGNVAEWTAEGSVMGGSSNNRPSGVRTSAKQMFEKSYRSFNIGFRCAADAK